MQAKITRHLHPIDTVQSLQSDCDQPTVLQIPVPYWFRDFDRIQAGTVPSIALLGSVVGTSEWQSGLRCYVNSKTLLSARRRLLIVAQC
jgi:hypothetical protein